MTRKGEKSAHYTRWAPVLIRAAEIVRAFEERFRLGMTLRKLFYKLVGEQLLPNDLSSYNVLSKRTGKGRKAGTFPNLAEDKVAIIQPFYHRSIAAALAWLRETHALDRSATQPYLLLIACEKRGTIPLLESWFSDDRHIRIVPLGGESSITTWQKVKRFIAADPRLAVVFYVGDYDSSGYGIRTRFKMNLGLTDEQFVHVTLTQEQVDRYRLPRAPGKDKVSRKDKDAFLEEVGEDVQVELDALDEDVLRELLEDAIRSFWDQVTFEAQLQEEERQRGQLLEIEQAERRRKRRKQ
jgi:hypothetical protein